MKKIFTTLVVILYFTTGTHAQQYGLFNTRTLFDAFENPAQKHFAIDSSRMFSSNFFLPYFGLSGSQDGNTDYLIRQMMYEGIYDTRTLTPGAGDLNHLTLKNNIYLLAFKFFKSYRYNQEAGFAWQLRSDANVQYTDETLMIFDSFRRFADRAAYTDIFNTKGYQQIYHQFSVSYREDIDKRLSVGVKASLLSGVAHNSVNIEQSSLRFDSGSDRLNIALAGRYRGNFVYADSLSRRDAYPLFKHPGLSITAGFRYQSKSGFTIMGNIKDLGFIKWNSKSYRTDLNANLTFDNLMAPNTNARVNNGLLDAFNDANERGGFVTPTNAIIDLYVSKDIGVYRPALIVSKNVFYNGGDVAMANTLTFGNLSGSIVPAYRLNEFFAVGAQGMYKTPNFEFFMGSDNLVKTAYTVKGLTSGEQGVGTGYNAQSFYMGLGIKFGRIVQHPMNSDYMPGIESQDTSPSFLQRMMRIFKKKDKLK